MAAPFGDTSFNQQHRFGSARFATYEDLKRASMMKPKGLPSGYMGETPLYLDTDGPGILIAGSGSGKMRDYHAYTLLLGKGERFTVLDAKGELYATTHLAFTHRGEEVFSYNPFGLHDAPQHRINILETVVPDSPDFHSDCDMIFRNLIPLSGSSNGKFFELRAQDIACNIAKADALRHGSTSLPRVYQIINQIESDPQEWADMLQFMLSCDHDTIKRTAGEVITKQQDSPREFGSIMAELYNYFKWLDEPRVAASLENPTVSFVDLVTSKTPKHLFKIIPAEQLKQFSPLIRGIYSAIMAIKTRNTGGPRLTFLIDEAGQLGHFPILPTLMTFGRGIGIRTEAVFQDIGQIKQHYKAEGLTTFVGSSVRRTFFGVRDYDTAEYIAKTLGTQTLTYVDAVKQSEAAMKHRQAGNSIFESDDPNHHYQAYEHYGRASQHRETMARRLMTPEEIMALPEDEMLVFVAGKNLPPVRCNKYPYYTRRETAGLYLPNPYHLPQYADGSWLYVDGYRPKHR